MIDNVKLPPPGQGIDPRHVTIVGVDTDDGTEHPLWQPGLTGDPDEELAESLGENGQLQAIVVRKNGPRVECVAGRERVKAARLWNDANPGAPLLLFWKLAPRGADDATLVQIVIAENEHRRDKPVVWKARMAERMLSRGRSTTDVARLFRVSAPTVREWLETLDVAPAVLSAVEAGEVSPADARAVRDIPHVDQEAALALVREQTREQMPAGSRPARKVAASRGPAPKKRAKRGPRDRPSLASTAGVRKKRPTPQEIKAAAEDPEIPNVDWRVALLWSIGERPFLVQKEDA
jgi:ParB family chromosome partitioning protein